MVDNFPDDSAFVGSKACVDGHSYRSPIFLENFRTLVNPVYRIIYFVRVIDFDFENWQVFSCEIGLIDQNISFKEDWVTRNVFSEKVKIARNELVTADFCEDSVSDHFDRVFSLSYLF